MKPRALILHATGTNRDLEAAQAMQLAGAEAEIVHLNTLRQGQRQWTDYQLLVLPGGFSYADALGAGRLLALDMEAYFADQAAEFIAAGKPVIGICNGFQALVKAGLLPGRLATSEKRLGGGVDRETGKQVDRYVARDTGALDTRTPTRTATLTFNARGHFECRWVRLVAQSQTCLWTRDLQESIYCPVAHGEGRFVFAGALEDLQAAGQVALVYAQEGGQPAGGTYPDNPNGSLGDVAGVCNSAGNVLGLMPHPEDHLFAYQHPRWTRGEQGGCGLRLFENGVRAVA